MKKGYSYEFCIKAADYFYKKENITLFNKFYSLIKAMQANITQLRKDR